MTSRSTIVCHSLLHNTTRFSDIHVYILYVHTQPLLVSRVDCQMWFVVCKRPFLNTFAEVVNCSVASSFNYDVIILLRDVIKVHSVPRLLLIMMSLIYLVM